MKPIVRTIVKRNLNRPNIELLNWAMNQLFRAAREIDLLTIGREKSYSKVGCDATAETILRTLVKTKRGYKLVKDTNPKLLRGYRKP